MGESFKNNLRKFHSEVKEYVEAITITIIGFAIFILAIELGILNGTEINKWAYFIFLLALTFGFPTAVGFFISWLGKHPKDALIYLATVFVLLAFFTILFNPENLFEILRLLVLILGGVVAFYGLIIASKRQSNFEEQVRQNQVTLKAQQRQNFNDQLGRAVEMLANQDQTSIRMAGVRILQESGKSSNIKRKQLVKEILVDYIHDKANLDNPKPYKFKTEIETAITAVASIQASKGLTFQKLRLNDLRFKFCKLTDVRFLSCEIKNTHFYKTTFENCGFYECDLTKARFSRSTFKNIVDFKVDLSSADIREIEGIEPKDFKDAYYQKDKHPIILLFDNHDFHELDPNNEFIWRDHNNKKIRHKKLVGGAENTFIPYELGLTPTATA